MLIWCWTHNGRLFSQVRGCTYDEALTRVELFSLKRPAFFLQIVDFCFVLAVVEFSTSCEARLLCGEVASDSEEEGLTILRTDWHQT